MNISCIEMMHTIDQHTESASGSSRSPRTDEQLLLHYRQSGERQAFEELVRRYQTELYSYLCRYLGDRILAEDVFQAAFLQLHLKCDQFEPGRKVKPWLYTIATNQAIDAQRRNKRHRMVSLDRQSATGFEGDGGSLLEIAQSDADQPDAELEQQERRDWVREAVASLPKTLREPVMLVYFQGLKYREAAEVLDVPVGTVKSRLHSAVSKLNEAYQRQ